MRSIVTSKFLVVVCAVAAVVLTGCATAGPTDSSTALSPTVSASSSSAPAASSVSVSAPPSTRPSGQAPSDSATSEPSVARESAATDPAAPPTPTTEPPDDSSALPADGSGGWYDTWGWVSPQTAQRALAAGIAAGKDVRGDLRCGTACGESPTAAEIQAQYIADHPDNPNVSIEAYEAAAAACPGYFIRGNCYADAEAARAAGEGE